MGQQVRIAHTWQSRTFEIAREVTSSSRVRGLMHDALSHSFNLVDGVFPGLRIRQPDGGVRHERWDG